VIFVFGKLNLSVTHWLRKALLWPTVFSLAFFASIYYLCNLFTQISWEMLIAKVACIIAVYAALFFTMGISKAERSKFKNALLSKLMPAGAGR